MLTAHLQGNFAPTKEEMLAWFDDRPQWLETSSVMLASCRAEIPKAQIQMPKYPVPADDTADNLLIKAAFWDLPHACNKMTYRQPIANDSIMS